MDEQDGEHTILLSVCVGARNLADTGLLNGRSATTHHYLFPFMVPRSYAEFCAVVDLLLGTAILLMIGLTPAYRA